MELYKINGKRLESLDKEAFALEKDLQSLVEENLETLFGLRYVSSQFNVEEYRIDSLAFDEEANSFVIIEYKKGQSSSVIDQGYAYLSAMLNNKADFVLEFNEKTERNLKRNQIDWSSSRVLFVSNSFTGYQKKGVNFKDIPFELWEVQKFAGGLVSADKIQTSSRESIKGLTKNKGESVINKEIVAYSEDDHIGKLSDSMREVWDSLREGIEEMPDVSISAKKAYLGFKRGSRKFCRIYFTLKSIRIELPRGTNPNSKKFFCLNNAPEGVAKEKNWEQRTGTKGYYYEIELKNHKNMKYAIALIEQKYNAV